MAYALDTKDQEAPSPLGGVEPPKQQRRTLFQGPFLSIMLR
jgi:hypothetical protein